MNFMAKRTVVVTTILVSGLSLSGCVGWTINTKLSCTTNSSGQTSCTGSIGGSKKIEAIGYLINEAASNIPDASDYSLDTTGSTIPYPGTGHVTITLKSDAAGSVVAAKTFDWVRTGNVIVLADPDAVNAWVASNPSADDATYTLVPFATQLAVGDNIYALAVRYNDETEASNVKHIEYGGRPGGPPIIVNPKVRR